MPTVVYAINEELRSRAESILRLYGLQNDVYLNAFLTPDHPVIAVSHPDEPMSFGRYPLPGQIDVNVTKVLREYF